MEKKANIGASSEVLIRWSVRSFDYSHEKEEAIRASFAEKYGIPISRVKVEPVFISTKDEEGETALTYDVVKNIHDPLFQQQLFKEYIKEYNITDYDFDTIVSIDSMINSQMNYDIYDKCRRYNIDYIKWDNFLSYGTDNYFDFNTLEGLVLLNGRPANQSGKSTFSYDLIHYALFGKTSSGKINVLADYFNKNLPEATQMKVEVGLTIDGVSYVIRRKLTRPELGKKNRNKVTQTVEWYKLENGEEIALEDDGENMNAGINAQTNKAIKEALGNEKDFDLVICANADNLKSLISLKDTERGRLLSRWIGLLPLEHKDELARATWNQKINIGFKSSVYNRETLAQEINTLNATNEESRKSLEVLQNNIKKIDGDLENFEKKREELFTSLKTIDNSLLDVDVTTVENKINNIVEIGKRKAGEIQVHKNRIAEIGDVEFSEEEYQKNEATRNQMNADLAQLRADITVLKENVNALTKGEYCPTCGAKLQNVDNSKAIADKNKLIANKTAAGIALKTEFDGISLLLLGMAEKRSLKHEKDKLELKVSALEVERTKLRLDYSEQTKLKAELEKNREAILFNNGVNTNLNIIKENIRVANETRNYNVQNYTTMQCNIEQNERIIREKEGLIETILQEEKLIRNWKIYLQMVGKNGISKMVLRKALPTINAEMARLLDGVCDFYVEVTMDDSNDVTFELIRNNVRNSLASGSGYEQTVAALALRVVLGNMSTLSKPPFILLDEILSGVAKENYDNVKKLYDRIKESYKYVFHITHISDIADWHNQIVTAIKNENGISRIVKE